MRAGSRHGATWILAAALALAGCVERDPILPGQRLAVLEADKPQPRAEVTAVSAPPATVNADWTHGAGNAAHAGLHPALDWPLAPVWSVGIGRGNSDRSRITAAPVVGGGLIFVQDAAAQVSAFSLGGAPVWTADLTNPGERGTEGFGGGLALAGGRLIVTTGFGEVLALDPASGGVIWRQRLDAVVRAAPAATGETVYVIARNDVAYGINAETGRLRWSLPGSRGVAGLVGGAGPALTSGLAILPFASGQMVAVDAASGEPQWGETLSGGRRGFVRRMIGDISADPAVSAGRVFAGTQAGEVTASSAADGSRIWTLGEGAYGPIWPAGNSVFFVSDEQELIRARSSDGVIVWTVALPGYENPGKRKHLTAHFGPVLAGGRLLVAGGDGVLRAFDPASGALIGEIALPGGAAAQPVVAGGLLFVTGADGSLTAFQ
jgi:outer membrane protein assembly factor BamB